MKQIDDISSSRLGRADVPWDDNGRVVIRKRKFGRFGTAFLRMFRIKTELTLKLDTVGSEVWRQLDGRTAGEVLVSLQKMLPKEEGLPARLGRYLSTLISYKLAIME
jgi:hypothetical protein